MNIAVCDFCHFIIRGSVTERNGKHFCDPSCQRHYDNGQTFNPNIPAHEAHRLRADSVTNASLRSEPVQRFYENRTRPNLG